MAKGLNKLTWVAQPKGGHDRRKSPRCQAEGCRRAVLNLNNGNFAEHCFQHATDEEMQKYYRAWGVK